MVPKTGLEPALIHHQLDFKSNVSTNFTTAAIKKKLEKSMATSYFRTVVLSSALKCLTAVFGMGTGVSTLPSSPH